MVYLIGKSGAGKSKTGNMLIGSNTFKSKVSPKPVTSDIECGYRDFQGRRFVFVDAPGLFFDKHFSEEKMIEELAKAALILAPGPHVFILVIGLNRFDDSEAKVIDMYKKAFGDGIMNHIIVVCTGKDQLDENGDSIENFAQEYTQEQKLFFEKCGNRYYAINNLASETEKEVQATMLMGKILELDKANQGKYHDNEDLKLAEKEVVKRLEDMHIKDPKEEAVVLRSSLRLEVNKGSSSTKLMAKIVVGGGVGIAAAVAIYFAGPATVLSGMALITKVASSLK